MVAYALFESVGYAETTMDDIARAAGVSRRTVFRYFESKERLVFPLRDERLAEFRDSLREAAQSHPPYGAVREACLEIAARMSSERERLLTQDRIVRENPALVGLERLFDSEYEAAVVETLLDAGRTTAAQRFRARILGGAILGVVRTTLRDWLDDGARADLRQRGAEAFRIFEAGVR